MADPDDLATAAHPDVTPARVGVARRYPEVERGALRSDGGDRPVLPSERVMPDRPPPLVLPSWGRREVTDPVAIDLPFRFPDRPAPDIVRDFARAQCPLGLNEIAHLPPVSCSAGADRIERRPTPDEVACLRESLERARAATEHSWSFCQAGVTRTYEAWTREYYDALIRALRELGCPPIACETLRMLAESTGDIRSFTGCPQGFGITYRLRLGSTPARLDELASSIPIVECRPHVSFPRPRPPEGGPLVFERLPTAGAPVLVSGLALEGPASDGNYNYPRGCRVSGAYLQADGVVVIASIEAFGDGRALQIRRLGVHAGAATFGRLVGGSTEVVAIGSAPPPADTFGRNGLRAHQHAVAPELSRPALFAIVDSGPGEELARHFIVEAGPDPVVPAQVSGVEGLIDPYPAPAGIAYGRPGAGTAGRIAFAYARLSSGMTTIEFGFVTRMIDRWVFDRTASLPCPHRVEDNIGVIYNPVAAEWVVAFVPGDYEPGAVAQRLDFDGRPRSPAPTEVVSGAGDGLVGPHSGLTLALNRRTGRYLLSVSHNVAPFEASVDGSIRIVANDGRSVAPSLHEEFDRFVGPVFYRNSVWTVAPSYVAGLEFRGGGPQRLTAGGDVIGDVAGDPTVCALCSPPGAEFRRRLGPQLWPGGRGRGFVHQYVELPDSDQYLALIAHERVPDPGGELYATFIEDGPIPPL